MSNTLDDNAKKASNDQGGHKDSQRRDSVTQSFLHSLGTSREIGRPIKVEEGFKPRTKTSDDYEILYDPEIDKNHPLDKWRRNVYLRCMLSREIARYLDRQTFITVSTREALLYGIFLILLIVITFGSFSLEKFYLNEAMVSRYTELAFEIEDLEDVDDDSAPLGISFYQINTLEHVWFYQSHIAENLIYRPFWYTQDRLYENKLMGQPQIRQLRTKNCSCEVHGYSIINSTMACYMPYSESNEETDNMGLDSQPTTERLALVNKWLPATKTGSLPYGGTFARYGGGGYVALLQNEDDAVQLTAALKSFKWYSRATRAIFIDFAIYNGNVNLFCIFKLLFEIPPSGGVLPSAMITTKKLLRYNDGSDYVILACEIVCMIFVVFYTVQKILEIKTLRLKLFKSFWNYIDVIVLIMSYFTFIFNVLLYINMNKLLPILKDPSYEDKYISFDTPLYLHILFSRSFAVLIAFAFLRLLKYFNIVHSIYRLHSTVHRALPDIMSYFIIFFYLYFVFAFVGLFLFGSKLEDFKTFLLALFALMRYSIADFKFDALEQADPILGPIFFFTYIFFMVFIVASMFLAILVPHYKEVLSEVSIGGAKTFISDMMLIWLMQLLGKLECSWLLSQIEREVYEEKVHSPSEHVRYYLAQAGYSELEIELFFKKYDITDMKIDAMDPTRTNFRKGEREAPPPLSQKDILRYILINKLDYLEGQYGEASKLLDKFLQKLDSVNVK